MNGSTETPTALEIFDVLTELVTGLVVGATIFPGFLLCVPGLVFFAFLLAIPLVAGALAVLAAVLAGSAVATPFLLIRFLSRRWRSRVSAERSIALQPISVSPSRSSGAPHEYVF